MNRAYSQNYLSGERIIGYARKHIKLINQFHVLSFTRSISGLKFGGKLIQWTCYFDTTRGGHLLPLASFSTLSSAARFIPNFKIAPNNLTFLLSTYPYFPLNYSWFFSVIWAHPISSHEYKLRARSCKEFSFIFEERGRWRSVINWSMNER